jgi:DNA-binding MarR family transcriptional regulator
MSLGKEIGKVRSFESLEQEAALNVARTADVLEREMGQVLKESKLSTTQYNVLRILRGAGTGGRGGATNEAGGGGRGRGGGRGGAGGGAVGGASEGLACGEVAERMISRDPDMTRLLDRLEKRGLIERCRGKLDRRVVKARITASGLKLLSGLDGVVAKAHREQLGHLGAGKLKQLIALLEAARERNAAEVNP